MLSTTRASGGNTVAGPVQSVEAVQHFVGVAAFGGFEERRGEGGVRAPAFAVAQRGADGLASNVEAAAFVSVNVAPAACARRFSEALSP